MEELEAEQRMADELDELHGHEVEALRSDKEQLQEALKKAEADAVELGRAASCLAAERDEREEANTALKARVFDLESDLKALRRDHKNLRRESSSMQRRIGDPQALRLAEQRFDSSRVDAFAAEARLLACRAAVEDEDVDIVAQATQDVARGVLLAKARVVLAESPERAFAYYARGASQTSSDDDIGEALASLSIVETPRHQRFRRRRRGGLRGRERGSPPMRRHPRPERSAARVHSKGARLVARRGAE